MTSPHYVGSSLDVTKYIDGNEQKITIMPSALDITWGGDPRYWKISDDKGAELIQVSWIEVRGNLEMKHLKLSPSTSYKLEFVVHLTPDAFGWKDSPVYLMAKDGATGKYKWKNADLSLIKQYSTLIPASTLEFTTPSKPEDKLQFGLFEIWKGRWKGGLVIEKVVITKLT